MSETPDIRLKRLRMRSWRRGIKEMDLLLGQFADGALERLDPSALDAYEALLDENDQELYTWVSGQVAPHDRHAAIVSTIRAFHTID